MWSQGGLDQMGQLQRGLIEHKTSYHTEAVVPDISEPFTAVE